MNRKDYFVSYFTLCFTFLFILFFLTLESTLAQTALPPKDQPEIEEKVPQLIGNSDLGKDAKYSSPFLDLKSLPGAEVVSSDMADMEAPSSLPPRIEIIVDSSGSMGQALDETKTRMYFMKKMITRYFTDQFKQKAQTGLRVYGARRKADCSDNELLVPFNEKSLGIIESKVSALQPTGKTPLYKSVLMAAHDLKPYKGPKAIVVFTDGEDTCGGNPCKEGKEASVDPFLNIQVYVVSIGLKNDPETLKKTSCLGENSTADSEEELFDNLGKIHSKIFSKQINLRVQSPDPSAEVQLFQEVKGEWKHVRSFTASFGATVPPGKYQAVVLLNPAYKFNTFTIPPRKVVTLKVAGEGTLTVEFLNKILDVEVLDKNLKPVKKFKSDVAVNVPMGKWTLKLSKQPFFERLVPRFEIFPNGVYNYKVKGVGALEVKKPDLVGLYVYAKKNQILGNYLTNYAFALPIGNYRVHIDDKCTFDEIDVRDDGKLKSLRCE